MSEKRWCDRCNHYEGYHLHADPRLCMHGGGFCDDPRGQCKCPGFWPDVRARRAGVEDDFRRHGIDPEKWP